MTQKAPDPGPQAVLQNRKEQGSSGNDAAEWLLKAISNSATRMDQIVQRRVGLRAEPPPDIPAK